MLRLRVEEILKKAVCDRWGGEAAVDARIEPTRDSSHGDFAANIAMILAKRLKRSPREIAQEIIGDLEKNPGFRRVEIAGPGFINFTLAPSVYHELLEHILCEGARFGESHADGAGRLQIEFVSANPTGPLNVVSARASAIGDTLARLLEATGHEVDREFYVNDHGSQVDHLLETVLWYMGGKEGEFPEDGYRGAYVEDLAEEASRRIAPLFVRAETGQDPERVEELTVNLAALVEGDPDRLEAGVRKISGDSLPLAVTDEAFRAILRLFVLECVLKEQREDLAAFGVRFDRWFRESELHTGGLIDETFDALKKSGDLFEEDGALWFRSSRYVDSEDRVVTRSNGIPTYFLADIAYHHSKGMRGYDHAIDILGPDHHGHVPRMQSAMMSLGWKKEWLEVLIVQQVNLLRKGEVVKMSKRAGEFVTLRDLVSETGRDAARFFFLMLRPNSHLNFDLDLAVSRSLDNPVYYVQYAHARICSVIRHAAAAGVREADLGGADLGLVDHEAELSLLRALDAFPDTIAMAALTREPHRIPVYLKELASLFHGYYHKVKVVTDDRDLTLARLALVKAVQIVTGNGLKILGVGAPEAM